MPKLKTKSGAKIFKVTATGKVMAAHAGKRHGMIKRTKKQIRQLRGTRVLFKTDGCASTAAWPVIAAFPQCSRRTLCCPPGEDRRWSWSPRQARVACLAGCPPVDWSPVRRPFRSRAGQSSPAAGVGPCCQATPCAQYSKESRPTFYLLSEAGPQP
jgi:large subunit ribosomal protein L35